MSTVRNRALTRIPLGFIMALGGFFMSDTPMIPIMSEAAKPVSDAISTAAGFDVREPETFEQKLLGRLDRLVQLMEQETLDERTRTLDTVIAIYPEIRGMKLCQEDAYLFVPRPLTVEIDAPGGRYQRVLDLGWNSLNYPPDTLINGVAGQETVLVTYRITGKIPF